ncbi:GlcG/HbpS family heme-binding protein [Roseovarius sp. S4756]|uniref:GlcG/HbpS family heme-binding protein n=1 Tax=Roseovarius maritimus TaxID=3342637 RepID=UPI0037293526
MNSLFKAGAFAAIAGLTAPMALARDGGVLSQKTLSLELANQLASGAIAACAEIDQNAVVAVVDRGGNLVALQRGDNVGPHNTVAAQRKAFTSLSTKSKSGALGQRAADDPASRNLNTVSELLLLGGGVPVTVDGETIGAVGVAGAGGSANDEACAVQAIENVGL